MAGAIAVIGVTCAALYAYRRQQATEALMARLDAGKAALVAGNPREALDELKAYIRARPNDPEALLALAKARARVPMANGLQLEKAKRYLMRVPEDARDEAGIREQLLDLALRTHDNDLAAKLTKRMIEEDGPSPRLLAARARALFRQKEFVRALPVLNRHNEIAALEIDTQLLTLATLQSLDRPIEELLAHAERLRAEHGDGPAPLLVSAVAERSAGNLEKAVSLAERAAERPAADVAFVERLTDVLETYGRFETARAALERAAEKTRSPRVRRLLVRRLWQAGN